MSGDNIKVAIRIRPLIQREVNANNQIKWAVENKAIKSIDPSDLRVNDPYTFDHIYNTDSTNQDLYEEVVRPLVRKCADGYNCTIFTYGQTSSGKTYTMDGTPKDPGIIPRVVDELFEIVESESEVTFWIRVTYVEIYNEKIYDLLNQNAEVKVREDFHGNINVCSTECLTKTKGDVMKLMKLGKKSRRIQATAMNITSSRSHALFRIMVESKAKGGAFEGGFPTKVSYFNLVDLAGSERVIQTKATGQRFAEGVAINKSLSTLTLVISQLSEGKTFISYRDSKLTLILKNSLGGNADTVIVANITPASLEDSHSTLSFAKRAKTIKNQPILNIADDNSMINDTQLQIQRLQSKLQLALEQNQSDKVEAARTIEELHNKISLHKRVFGMSVMSRKSSKRRHTIGEPSNKFTFKPPSEERPNLFEETLETLSEQSLFREFSSKSSLPSSVTELLSITRGDSDTVEATPSVMSLTDEDRGGLSNEEVIQELNEEIVSLQAALESTEDQLLEAGEDFAAQQKILNCLKHRIAVETFYREYYESRLKKVPNRLTKFIYDRKSTSCLITNTSLSVSKGLLSASMQNFNSLGLSHFDTNIKDIYDDLKSLGLLLKSNGDCHLSLQTLDDYRDDNCNQNINYDTVWFRINNLENDLDKKNQEIEKLRILLKERNTEIEVIKNDKFSEEDFIAKKLEKDKKNEIQNLNSNFEKRTAELEQLRETLREKDFKEHELRTVLEKRNHLIENLERDLERTKRERGKMESILIKKSDTEETLEMRIKKLEKDLTDKDYKIQVLQMELAKGRDEVEKLCGILNEKDASEKKLKGHIIEIESNQQNYLTEINTMKEGLKEKMNEIEFLRNDLNRKDCDIEELKSTLNGKMGEIEQMRNSTLIKENELVQSFEKVIVDRNDIIEMLESDLESKNTELENLLGLLNEKNTIEQNLRTVLGDRDIEIENVLTQNSNITQKYEKVLNELDRKKIEIERVNSVLNENMVEIKQLQNSVVTEKLSTIQRIEEAVYEKNVVIDNLKSDLEKKNIEVEKLWGLLNEKSTLEQNLTTVLKEKDVEIKNISTENSAIKQRCKEDLDEKNNQLDNINGTLNERIIEIRQLKTSIETLEKAKSEKNVDIKSLKTDLDKKNIEIEKLWGLLNEKSAIEQNLTIVLKERDVEIKNILTENNAIKQKCKEDLDEKNNHLDNINGALNEKIIEIRQLKSSIEILEKDKGEKNVAIKSLKTDLDKKNIEIEKLWGLLNEKSAIEQNLTTVLKEKDVEIKNILTENNAIKQKCKGDLDEKNNQLDNINGALNERIIEIRHLKTSIETLEKAKGEKNVAIKSLKTDLDKKNIEIEKLWGLLNEKSTIEQNLTTVLKEKDVKMKIILTENDAIKQKCKDVLDEKDNQLKNINSILNEKIVEIKQLKDSIVTEKDSATQRIKIAVYEKDVAIKNLKVDLDRKNTEIENIRKSIITETSAITQKYEKALNEKNNRLERIQNELDKQNYNIEKLTSALSEQLGEIEQLQNGVEKTAKQKLEKLVKEKDRRIENLQRDLRSITIEVEQLHHLCAEKSTTEHKLQTLLNERNTEIEKLQKNNLTENLTQKYEKRLIEKNEEIEKLRIALNEKLAEIDRLQGLPTEGGFNEKEVEIKRLENALRETNATKAKLESAFNQNSIQVEKLYRELFDVNKEVRRYRSRCACDIKSSPLSSWKTKLHVVQDEHRRLPSTSSECENCVTHLDKIKSLETRLFTREMNQLIPPRQSDEETYYQCQAKCLKDEVEALQSRQRLLEKECSDLKAKLEIVTKEKESMQKQLVVMSEKYEKYRALLKFRETTIKKLQQQIEKL